MCSWKDLFHLGGQPVFGSIFHIFCFFFMLSTGFQRHNFLNYISNNIPKKIVTCPNACNNNKIASWLANRINSCKKVTTNEANTPKPQLPRLAIRRTVPKWSLAHHRDWLHLFCLHITNFLFYLDQGFIRLV